MEPDKLIYALNEFIVIYRKFLQNHIHIDTIFIIINIFSIIKFQGLVAGQPYLCKNIPYWRTSEASETFSGLYN